MVTREQLHEYIGRRPFQPFRLKLINGESVDITRTLQAAATRTQVIVGTPEDRLRWIQLSQIERVDTIDQKSSAA